MNVFREPTGELPDLLTFGSDWQTWLRQYDDERITLSQDDATGLDSECERASDDTRTPDHFLRPD